jgi:hypothetical protein
MNDALTLVMLFACAFVALLLIAAVAFGLWSTTARSKSRRPR